MAYFKGRNIDIVQILVSLYFIYFSFVNGYYKIYKYKEMSKAKLTEIVHSDQINSIKAVPKVKVKQIIKKRYILEDHASIVSKFFGKRKSLSTSNLGAIMFLLNDTGDFYKPKNDYKQFTVLIWRYYDWLRHRHLQNFGSKRRDPLDTCSVKNCNFIGDDKLLPKADAVLVHLQHGLVPTSDHRRASQRWIFLTDESPEHSFSLSHSNNWTRFAGIFNWSMTYRIDSDVPVPYGRVVPLSPPRRLQVRSLVGLIPNWKKKRRDTLLAILISNCTPFRINYIRELSKDIKVDVYGKCSTKQKNRCPGHFRVDCKHINRYLFYLVLENSKCKQYVTEKSFYHAYSKGSIPVIMGPSIDESEMLLPPGSFIHTDSYSSPKNLAKYIISISKHEKILLSYHKWRENFELLNEHGYFQTSSQHLCRVCEALNYNDESEKTYDVVKLGNFLDPKILCH